MPALADLKHEAFAQEYARTLSVRAAALAVGHTPPYGYGALKRPEVAARIDELAYRRFERAEITPERVMRELARIAFFDPRMLYDEHGDLLPVHGLDDDTAAVVSQIKVEVKAIGRGKDAEVVVTKDIKVADKMTALGILAKHFKLVGDDSDGVNALANALSARLNAARKRAFDRAGAADATIVNPGRSDYGVDNEPSDPNDVTTPRPTLDAPEPAPRTFGVSALHSRPSLPTAPGVDDEDLAG